MAAATGGGAACVTGVASDVSWEAPPPQPIAMNTTPKGKKTPAKPLAPRRIPCNRFARSMLLECPFGLSGTCRARCNRDQRVDTKRHRDPAGDFFGFFGVKKGGTFLGSTQKKGLGALG